MNQRYKSNYNSDDFYKSNLNEEDDLEEENDCNKMTFKELISDLENKIQKNDIINKEVENMIISNQNPKKNFLKTLDNFKNIDNEINEQNFASRKEENKDKEEFIINNTENKFKTFSNLENNNFNQHHQNFLIENLNSIDKNNDDEFLIIENSLEELKRKQKIKIEKKNLNNINFKEIGENNFFEVENLKDENINLKRQNKFYSEKIKILEEEKFLQKNNILTLKEKILNLEAKLLKYKSLKKKPTKKKSIKNIYEKIQNNYDLDKYSQIHKKNYKSFK